MIGQGRDRRVYAHGRRYVRKQAKNGDGRLQNLREAIASRLAPPEIRHLARVSRVADSGLHIISERMVVVSEATFERRIGRDFIPRLLRALRVATRERKDTRRTLGPELQAMLNFLVRDMGMALPDFERLENWGLRRVGRQWEPVLLDYGLSGIPDFFRRHSATLGELTRTRDSCRRLGGRHEEQEHSYHEHGAEEEDQEMMEAMAAPVSIAEVRDMIAQYQVCELGSDTERPPEPMGAIPEKECAKQKG